MTLPGRRRAHSQQSVTAAARQAPRPSMDGLKQIREGIVDESAAAVSPALGPPRAPPMPKHRGTTRQAASVTAAPAQKPITTSLASGPKVATLRDRAVAAEASMKEAEARAEQRNASNEDEASAGSRAEEAAAGAEGRRNNEVAVRAYASGAASGSAPPPAALDLIA